MEDFRRAVTREEARSPKEERLGEISNLPDEVIANIASQL